MQHRGSDQVRDTDPTKIHRKIVGFSNTMEVIKFVGFIFYHVRSFGQAFIETAATIHRKIQDGVIDVSNQVSFFPFHLTLSYCY